MPRPPRKKGDKRGTGRGVDPAIGGSIKPKKHKNADKVIATLKLETDKDIRKDIFAIQNPNPKVSFMDSRHGNYFMTEDGEFVKGGNDQHGELGRRFGKELDIKGKKDQSDWDDSRDIMARTNMIRITTSFFDDKTKTIGFDIAGEKITPAQLRRIRQYELEGVDLNWDVTDAKGVQRSSGNDFKTMAKALRDVEMMTEAKDKLPVFTIKLRKKQKEDVSLTGPHGRPAFRKRKKKSFEFKESAREWQYLWESKPLREDISKDKQAKLWTQLSKQKRQSLLSKMKLNRNLADKSFDELPSNVQRTFTGMDKTIFLGILALIAGTSLLGFYTNILNAPIDTPVSKIKDQPVKLQDLPPGRPSPPGKPDREPSFTHPSSFVGKVTYTPELQTMEILLNGNVYGFCDVPERVFDGFDGAGSKGIYFNNTIKGNFDC